MTIKNADQEIFWKNADGVLRDIDMQHLPLEQGALVDIVRWCMSGRSRPTHQRQVFLETKSPELLAYLEKLDSRGEASAWRTLDARVRAHLVELHQTREHPCKRPELAAIWRCLPELISLGRSILDHAARAANRRPTPTVLTIDPRGGAGGDGDKGNAGKTGTSAALKPAPRPRFALPVVVAELTDREKKELDLDDKPKSDAKDNEVAMDGPDEADQPEGLQGPKPPGGIGARR